MATHPIETVTPKPVDELHREHEQEYREMSDRQQREMREAVRHHLPIGTVVLYRHGENKVRATVVEHSQFEWAQDKVVIENVKSRSRREIEAWRLEIAPA